MKIKPLYYLLIVMLLVPLAADAQDANEKFGRNRRQLEEFDWKYLSSENFDVYFYRGSEKLAREVAEYLESEFDRITDLIGYPPYSKSKVFIYNSISDLQQSNVGVGEGTMAPGGETQFVKPYIEVAHPGSVAALKQELLTKVSALMVNEMMFGGSLKDMFQSAVLLNLPEWFITGAAKYVAEGWSIEMDDYAREFITSKTAKKLNRLSGREAALAGQSLWNYIAHKYGKSNISNILNYTRIMRNEERSIEITLGVSFEQLLYDWQNFYIDNKRYVEQSYQAPSTDNLISKSKNNKGLVHNQIKINADATKLAYTRNDDGRYAVIVKELDTGQERIVLKGGYRVIGQQIEYDLPIIDWADKSTLGIIHSKNGRMQLVLYDHNTNSKLPRYLDRLEQVKSMEFNDNGRLLAVSAVSGGRNDIYLLSTRRDRTKRLTNDIYDDLDPSFLPGSNTIVFSSNRISDTLDVKEKDIEQAGQNFNLFYFNLDTTQNVLYRVTNTVSQDVLPMASTSQDIYYLSDQRGIRNIFKYNTSDKIYSQVTNFDQSLGHYDLNFEQGALAFIYSDKGQDFVYFNPDFNPNQEIFTPQTLRQQVLQAKEMQARREARQTEGLTIEEIVKQRLEEKRQREEEEEELKQAANAVFDSTQVIDSVALEQGFIDTDNYTFDVPVVQSDTTAGDEEVINTDDYVFDEDLGRRDNSESFLAQYRQSRSEKKISGPFPYETRFSADNMLTTFVIDPLRGFGLLLEVELNDMLENHKFSGGAMTPFVDLKSGDFFVQYQYLKQFLDYSVRGDRRVITWENGNSLQQLKLNMFEAGASLPLSTKARVSVKPFYAQTRYENLVPSNFSFSNPSYRPIGVKQYLGATLEAVFDNSIINGMNLIEGTRGKASLRHYEGLTNSNHGFSRFEVDIRHYQKIHRELIFAVRGFYGSFFGNSPKKYLLGGMDNWIGRRVNEEGTNNPLRPSRDEAREYTDLLFVEYATNLRGFAYAELYGNNVLLMNAELRIPIVRYLSGGPISSNFLRNLQFTGFFDIGSSWSGKSPFSQDNEISTKVVGGNGNNFTINLKNFQNPWLYSYGWGFRTMLLGYYVKLDVAWPVENYNVQDPRLQFTLGYDF